MANELLPTLGTPDDRDAECIRGLERLTFLGQCRHEVLEGVPCPTPVLARDPEHVLEAESVEVDDAIAVMRGLVDLVDGEQDGPLGPAERTGDRLVLGQEPRLAVHHEEHRIGVADRCLGLRLHGALESRLRIGIEPRRIHQQDAPIGDLELLRDAIPRESRSVRDQGTPVSRVSG